MLQKVQQNKWLRLGMGVLGGILGKTLDSVLKRQK